MASGLVPALLLVLAGIVCLLIGVVCSIIRREEQEDGERLSESAVSRYRERGL